MNPLDRYESEQKMLTELKNLFEIVPPSRIRRNLEDLFFLYLISDEDPQLPDRKNFITNFYFLINFLNEMELISKKSN